MTWQYIAFEDIDIVKWNSCVHYAPNGNVFGYYWFLKNTIKEWDAIVAGDYDSVLAVPRSDPSGHLTPKYIRECGLYSIGLLNSIKVTEALSQFPKDGPQRIALNIGNPISEIPGYIYSERMNHSISLYEPYESIRQRFAIEIPELGDTGLYLDNQLNPEELVEYLFLKKQEDWDRFTALRIIYNALHRGIGIISALRDQKGKLQAAAFFIHSHGRIVHMLSATFQKRQSKSLLLLFDGMIRTHAGKPMIFDLNMEKNELTDAFNAESYSTPVLEIKTSKSNWWNAIWGRS